MSTLDGRVTTCENNTITGGAFTDGVLTLNKSQGNIQINIPAGYSALIGLFDMKSPDDNQSKAYILESQTTNLGASMKYQSVDINEITYTSNRIYGTYRYYSRSRTNSASYNVISEDPDISDILDINPFNYAWCSDISFEMEWSPVGLVSYSSAPTTVYDFDSNGNMDVYFKEGKDSFSPSRVVTPREYSAVLGIDSVRIIV